MNIIVGATGQIGSNLISEVKKYGAPVRAVVRNPEKLKDKSIEFREADLFDSDQLREAFEDGTTVFVITPESQTSNDIIGDTRRIVENYRKAVEQTGIQKVVGLSCVGAHVDGNTGNILMSRILEQGFDGLNARKIFVRPSYYFSNWLGYLDTIERYGILPTFFPEDLDIEMNSPIDVAKIIAKVIVEEDAFGDEDVIELTGQQRYNPRDVANIFSMTHNKPVNLQVISHIKWRETLRSVGFSENTAANLVGMTQAVIDNIAVPEHPGKVIKLPTTLEDYLFR
ncbi:NAD(P)H-binding protein [Parapedobacter deserti]|uniref:NAD(P)H-binding protein n=1 Tax=Parapedobacter deserti TaxID=1912957 RepID=A0ABV7JPN0_9SPHI